MATFVERVGIVIIFVVCSSAVRTDREEVILEPDMPFLSMQVNGKVELECCFKSNRKSVKHVWVKYFRDENHVMTETILGNATDPRAKSDLQCGILTLQSVTLTDSGLYLCRLETDLYTHGTYLQVYKPLDKTINLTENSKNKILTAEGILLLLCVLLPSATLLFKSKRVNALEKKKVMKEEENIYQGLNVDDCCTTYDQIERSQAQGPYQDVCNIIEEEEDIQLEKP